MQSTLFARCITLLQWRFKAYLIRLMYCIGNSWNWVLELLILCKLIVKTIQHDLKIKGYPILFRKKRQNHKHGGEKTSYKRLTDVGNVSLCRKHLAPPRRKAYEALDSQIFPMVSLIASNTPAVTNALMSSIFTSEAASAMMIFWVEANDFIIIQSFEFNVMIQQDFKCKA